MFRLPYEIRRRRDNIFCPLKKKTRKCPQYRSNKSKFTHHLYENGYAIRNIDVIVNVSYLDNKGRHPDTVEKYYTYIFKNQKKKNQISGESSQRNFSIQRYNPLQPS